MKLYLVEIGGMREGSLFESHEVHAVVAADEGQLVSTCAARFAKTMTAAHLDGWTEIDLDLRGRERPERQASFFVAELGRNSSASMREEHDYRFLEAASWKAAVQTARQSAPGWHVDACVDLDALAEQNGYALMRSGDGAPPQTRSQARYIRFV